MGHFRIDRRSSSQNLGDSSSNMNASSVDQSEEESKIQEPLVEDDVQNYYLKYFPEFFNILFILDRKVIPIKEQILNFKG